jgi:hypothetical protein
VKVPIPVSRLSEDGLLSQALLLKNLWLVSTDSEGVTVQNGPKILWDDSVLFTLSELKTLGFET